jgi:tetratricopeptide (TPR) repeat protein
VSCAHCGGMKHVKKVLLTVLLAGSQVVAQGDRQEQFHEACVFEKQGQFDKAINLAKGLIDSGQSSGGELGRAWILLGVVYTQQGRFAEAQNAFERSLRILDGPQFITDYADALQSYGWLYNDTGQIAIAGQMWKKALQLRQQFGDHAGVSRSLTSLAGLALARDRVREAKKYLQSAAEQAKLTPDLTDDDLAIGYGTQAWLALAEGHPAAAVADYERSLELSKRIHGERHWLTGWGYMLRGKAYSESGNVGQAFTDMREGLSILDQALGRKNPRYFAAQIAYSKALDRAGLSAQAAQWRAAGEQAEKDFYRSQCVGCTINVAAFR